MASPQTNKLKKMADLEPGFKNGEGIRITEKAIQSGMEFAEFGEKNGFEFDVLPNLDGGVAVCFYNRGNVGFEVNIDHSGSRYRILRVKEGVCDFFTTASVKTWIFSLVTDHCKGN